MDEYGITYGRGYAYSLQYHIVWCVSQNLPILIGDIHTIVAQSISDTLQGLDIVPIVAEVNPTYVHLVVSCKPQNKISDVVKILKGNSARKVFMRDSAVKTTNHLSHLWHNSYLVFSHRYDYKQIIDAYMKQL